MVEHLVEMAGALVRVRDGKVEVLTDPGVERCPLREDLYGCSQETRDTVEEVIRHHMEALGMYGPGRVLELDRRDVGFGASEILSDAMGVGLVDAAVVVCEGAGTVVVDRPEVLQAVGAHMTGLISTDPIPEVQGGLEKRGAVLLDRLGTIDQVKGYNRAVEAGYQKIAVTVTGHRAGDAQRLKRPAVSGSGPAVPVPVVLAVHNTGIGVEQAKVLAQNCDLVWSCASRHVREVVSRTARLQIGVSIPVYAMTDRGKRLALNRALHFEGKLVLHRSGLPRLREDRQPRPLI